jgi:hypothetical protein
MRGDLLHQPIDLVMWAAPYVAIGGALFMAARALNARRI